jgi:hypothetical protein
VERGTQGGAFALAEDETLKLQVSLDAPVVAIFANDRACLTSRIYPSRSDSLGIGLRAFPSNPSPGPLPDEVHRDSGPPSPLGRGLATENR